MIIQLLNQLGLKNEEAEMYKTCLEFGALSPTVLAKRTGIPRTSVYVHAEKLLKKGFFKSVKRGVSTYFSAIDPSELQTVFDSQRKRIDKKEEILRNNLPIFESFTKQSSVLPQVTYYQGIDNLGHVYKQIKKSSVFAAYVNLDAVALIAPEYIDKVFDIIQKEGMSAREMVVDSKIGQQYFERKNRGVNHEIKTLPKGTEFFSDNIILDDRIYFLSYNANEGIVAVEIRNDTLVHTQRSMFDLVWKVL